MPSAQGGRLLRVGSDLVALKIVKVVASIESTIREQAKFMLRRKSLAARTRVLILCFGTHQ